MQKVNKKYALIINNMKSAYILLTFLCLVQWSCSQVFYTGTCKSYEVENFNPKKYLGRWYEHSKYPFIFEAGGKCIYAQYKQQADGDISIYNFMLNEVTNKPVDIQGSAKYAGNGRLKVRFNSMPSFLGPADYWVISTDYDNYAVVVSCIDILGVLNTKVVWILTRQRQPDAQIISHARDIITANGLSLDSLKETKQSGCGA